MASLNEVKTRIASVRSTVKITSAMKMVASAKLLKAQKAIGNILPYEREMRRILVNLMKGGTTPFLEGRAEVRSVALVCFSSNQSMCGAFNANVIRAVLSAVEEYQAQGIKVVVYAVGKKMFEAMNRRGIRCHDCSQIAATASYASSCTLGKELQYKFHGGSYDRVELIYSHFKSMSSQPVIRESFLPFAIPSDEEAIDEMILGKDVKEEPAAQTEDVEYIVEPSRRDLLYELVPKVALLKMYSVVVDAAAAEHAARTLAMQVATDNGNDLLSELTLEYNKGRQQKITAEILDLVGGSAG